MRLFSLIYLVIWIAAVFGWCKNIYILATMGSFVLAEITILVVLRIVGIFIPPLGAVLGYL